MSDPIFSLSSSSMTWASPATIAKLLRPASQRVRTGPRQTAAHRAPLPRPANGQGLFLGRHTGQVLPDPASRACSRSPDRAGRRLAAMGAPGSRRAEAGPDAGQQAEPPQRHRARNLPPGAFALLRNRSPLKAGQAGGDEQVTPRVALPQPPADSTGGPRNSRHGANSASGALAPAAEVARFNILLCRFTKFG